MHEHPLRRSVVGEMHLRKWPDFPLPSLIIQWVRVVQEDDRQLEVEAIAAGIGIDQIPLAPTHLIAQTSGGTVVAWERHSEGSTLTAFLSGGAQAFLSPHEDCQASAIIAWAENLPGEVVRATRILVAAGDEDLDDVIPKVAFSQSELISCHVNGSPRIWSDFRIQSDGYGRLLVAANGLHPSDFVRLVQRVQELGNYRNRALLGLPVAKKHWPLLDDAERRLQDLAVDITNGLQTDDRLMAQLSALSLELMAISTRVTYRMNATAAYAALVEERLQDLDCRPIAGFASLSDFTQRRFLPAVRTCAAFSDREKELSIRFAQITSLLRARIETRIENQNGQLLRSMANSAQVQLRLQQLVESLSIVALAYYLMGLISYVLKGTEHVVRGIDVPLILAMMAVPVTFGMWWALQVMKKRILH